MTLHASFRSTFQPSDAFLEFAPARWRFAVKLFIAITSGIVGVLLIGNDEWGAIPYGFIYLATLIGPRNFYSLMSPPYFRLSQEGIELRVWRVFSAQDVAMDKLMIYPLLFAKFLWPFRMYETHVVSWDRVLSTGYSGPGEGALRSTMTIRYRPSNDREREVVFSRSQFEKNPQAMFLAIQQFQDLIFRWGPLCTSGALKDWFKHQQDRFREPVIFRYQLNYLELGVGISSLACLSCSLIAIILNPSWSITLFPLVIVCCFAFRYGRMEVVDFLVNRSRSVVVLSSMGVGVGYSIERVTLYEWDQIYSARLWRANWFQEGRPVGVQIFGLHLGLTDGATIFLPNKYDRSLEWLEQALNPITL